jgi:hypothetical protein
MSTLTLQQALYQLNNQSGSYNSVQALYELAKQVNVDARGDVTILYSGQTTLYGTNGKPIVSTDQIFDSMKRNGDSVRIINDTDAAKLLNSDQFKEALASQYGLTKDDLDSKYNDLSPTKQAALKAMNDALYHPTTGPWAQASARFVDATVGEVRTLTGGASADRIFGQTEVPAALKNTKITSIDGIARADLAEKPLADAVKAITAQSDVYSAGLKVATDSKGNILLDANGQPRLDSRAYFEATGLQGKAPVLELPNYKNLAEFMPDRLSQHEAGARVLQDISAKYEAQSKLPDLPGQDNAALRASSCISKTTAANQPYWLQAA